MSHIPRVSKFCYFQLEWEGRITVTYSCLFFLIREYGGTVWIPCLPFLAPPSRHLPVPPSPCLITRTPLVLLPNPVGGGGGGRDTSYWLFLFLFTATWRRNGRKRELGADGSRSCSGGGWGGGWICTEKVQQRNLTCGELAGTGSAETGKPILFNMNSDTEIILPSNFYLIGCKVNTRA